MAIGAVVSNRNFGCFVGSGREQRISRGDRMGCAALQYAQWNMLYNERCLSRSGLSYSGCIYRSYSQSTGPLDGKSFGSKSPFYVEVIQPNRFSESSNVINPRQRTIRWECYLSSADSGNSWVQPRKLDKLGSIDGQKQQKKHAAVNRTQADYKSDEYDITGALESLVSSEGASEAILAEEVEQSIPWWEQFPRRWIVVLLCFAEFLLCNMDRAYSSPKDDPGLSVQEKRLIMGGSVSKEPVSNIPWKLILSKAPVWALIISHFCHNWGTFIHGCLHTIVRF